VITRSKWTYLILNLNIYEFNQWHYFIRNRLKEILVYPLPPFLKNQKVKLFCVEKETTDFNVRLGVGVECRPNDSWRSGPISGHNAVIYAKKLSKFFYDQKIFNTYLFAFGFRQIQWKLEIFAFVFLCL